MSNAKRFLSIILAIVLVCSTLVVGASAAYNAYKDEAIAGQYNALDKPVLTTEQYASAAMDEIDRMLSVDPVVLTRADIYVGELNITSVDATLDSVVNLVNGRTFDTFKGMLGDLAKLNVDALTVRRGDTGKTDIDIIYSLLKFLYDNKGLITSFLDGSINLGSLLPSVVDISEYQDVNKFLRKMAWEEVYSKPFDETATVDSMAQTLITNLVKKEVPEFVTAQKDYTKIEGDGRNAYTFIDDALKVFYNAYGINALNGTKFHNSVKKACDVEVTKNADGTFSYNYDNVNGFYDIINCDFTIPKHTFSDSRIAAQELNSCLGEIIGALLKDSFKTTYGFTWATENGNEDLLDNVINLAKAVIKCDNASDLGLFAKYIHRATDAEVEAMSAEELVTYALRAIINGSVDGMYIPDSVTTIRDFGYYTLTQLLATSAPTLDFSGMPHTTETILIMGVDFAIYNINAELDMGLNYVYDMAGVEAELKKAAKYGIDNYGGLLQGLGLNSATAGGWETFDKVLFQIIPVSWLPLTVGEQPVGNQFKTFLIDVLLENILDLNLSGLLDMLKDHAGELHDNTIKQVLINLATRIVNIIFPGAIASATTFDAIITNQALANTVDALFSDLYNLRVDLVASVLPIVCQVLDLTNAQKFKFPAYTYDTLVKNASGAGSISFSMKNNCTGINTGYTDKNGVFHQDSLYKFTDVTVSVDGVTLTSAINQSKTVIKPGEVTNISFAYNGAGTGKAIRIDITYNVTTEDGSNLTTAPLSESLYIYSANAESDIETLGTAATVGNYTLNGPKFLYAKSFDDIVDYKVTLTSKDTSAGNKDITIDASGMLSTGTLDLTQKQTAAKTRYIPSDYFEAKTNQAIVPATGTSDDEKAIANIGLLQFTDAYKALPRTSEPDEETGEVPEVSKESLWNDFVAYACGYTTAGAMTTYGKIAFTTTTNKPRVVVSGQRLTTSGLTIFPYNDYNLGSILENEIDKHRQQNDYSDATAWTAYKAAMLAAADAVYSPFINTKMSTATGKASKYQGAYENLKAAIETLEASAQSAGFDKVFEIVDQYNPDNGDLEYYEDGYNFFGVADYVPYTYYNYRQEYKSAMSAYNATQPDPDEPDKELKVVDSLSVTNYAHRLELMGGRLLDVTATKIHLADQLTKCMPMTAESNYTAESWAAYKTAYDFATSVNNDTTPTLKQSKVDTAYENLLETEKRLIPANVTPPADEPTYEPISTTEVKEYADGIVLTSVGADVQNIAKYFDVDDCTVEIAENESGKYSTGSVVTVKDLKGGVLATYVVAVAGDINGDGSLGDGFDLAVVVGFASGKAVPSESCIMVAGDIGVQDEKVDTFDLNPFVVAASGKGTIDPIARELA